MAGMTGAAIDLGDRASADLRWVVSAVWGGLDGVAVRLGGPRAGERVLADLVVVPDARRPRMLVPRDRRAARAAVAAGAATRARSSRLGRGVARAALGTPASRVLFRDRLVVVATAQATVTVGDLLAEALGRPVLLTVNVRPPSPARKPVLQVLGEAGEVLAYAKVGWHPVSDVNVAAESRFLHAVADGDVGVAAPVPLADLEYRGHRVLVTAPMPEGIERLRPDDPPPDPAITARIGALFGTVEEPIGSGVAIRRLRERLAATDRQDDDVATAIVELLDGVAVLDVVVPVGAWHGDWSPWNLGRRGGRTWAWDWEYARTDVPVGFDLAHYGFQVAFVAQRRPLGEAFSHARRAAAGLLADLGLDGAARDALHALHVAEVGTRYLESRDGGVEPPTRFTDVAGEVIRAEAARITG
jgi:hypothetical protein